MSSIMILAESEHIGRRYARKDGLDRRDVIPAHHTDRARGRAFEDFIIVGNVRLDEAQWAALTPCFLRAGEEVLDRFFYEAQGKLPPPIELPRRKVVKL